IKHFELRTDGTSGSACALATQCQASKCASERDIFGVSCLPETLLSRRQRGLRGAEAVWRREGKSLR
ncbi:hypothetical protein BDZ91DRAFT_724377, partial [Kalaharituber pfeilii]